MANGFLRGAIATPGLSHSEAEGDGKKAGQVLHAGNNEISGKKDASGTDGMEGVR